MSDSLRIISRDNGVGLSRDLALLGGALAGAGMAVDAVGFGGDRTGVRLREAGLWARRVLQGKVEMQLFCERVYPHCLPLARRNLLIPNPEWFLPKWLPWLPRFEQVLCKTRHAERIFRRLGCRTRYLGFTSEDRLDLSVPRRPSFFHLAGRSSAKGTKVLLETWLRHPEWPLLTVVQHPRKAGTPVRAGNIDHRAEHVDDATLRRLQNAHLFHVCPSETEGFGHYLMEALSVGAITLATAAEPMTELVTAARGLLIQPVRQAEDGLATRYFVDAPAIEQAVEQALALSPAQRSRLCMQARHFFVGNDAAFRERLARLLVEDSRIEAADVAAAAAAHG